MSIQTQDIQQGENLFQNPLENLLFLFSTCTLHLFKATNRRISRSFEHIFQHNIKYEHVLLLTNGPETSFYSEAKLNNRRQNNVLQDGIIKNSNVFKPLKPFKVAG